MFGLGNNDEEQRFWNFILFKIPMTDEEIESVPGWWWITCMVIIIVIIVLISLL